MARFAFLPLALLLLLAPGPARPQEPAGASPSVTIPIAPSSFETFLAQMRERARAAGISDATFAAATAGIAPIPEIVAMNENQPEFSRPVWAYLDGAVSKRRLRDGQAMLRQHRATLHAIARDSGVPAEILVAIWGLESDYGRGAGEYPLFSALATMGYLGLHGDYAGPEFLAALKILQQQHYAVADMKSSWAGAFGQTQFTPTTFLKYAADGDGDGHIDLWHSPADALASAAGLLTAKGWKKGGHWCLEVRLPKNFAYEEADLETRKPLREWRRLGVARIGGARLPVEGEAAIYLPAGAKGPAFLVFPNFDVILEYNNAASYALAVSVLADRIMGRPGVKASWPRDEQPLSRDERIAFQQALAASGFDPGAADGVLGRRSRAATRQYQKAHGLPADGYPTHALLDVIAAGAKN
jgi:membrane-bound lytic murein transglycosylase B